MTLKKHYVSAWNLNLKKIAVKKATKEAHIVLDASVAEAYYHDIEKLQYVKSKYRN
jgi:hypothetical protein